MTKSSIQADFFAAMRETAEIRLVFDHLSDVYFFVKNRSGQIVSVSSAILNRLGISSEDDFIGKTDFAYFPKELAEAYARDDEEVFRTGKPLIDRLEMWIGDHGLPAWCVTSKLPLHDKSGNVIGLMGITRPDFGQRAIQPSTEAMRAMEYLRKNVCKPISNAMLAEAFGMSERTLARKIVQAFGYGPHQLFLRVRIQGAAEALLKTNDSISEIALSYGFCDQSAFTRQFRESIGVTPAQFRKQK